MHSTGDLGNRDDDAALMPRLAYPTFIIRSVYFEVQVRQTFGY